jgi:hypothetical protein
MAVFNRIGLDYSPTCPLLTVRMYSSQPENAISTGVKHGSQEPTQRIQKFKFSGLSI